MKMNCPLMPALCALFCALFCFAHSAGAGESSIHFIGLEKGAWRVFRINTEGTGLTPVGPADISPVSLSATPDGKKLLIAGSGGVLHLFDTTTDDHSVLDIGMQGMTDAMLSIDGKKILFSLSIAGSIDANDIWLAIRDGGKVSRLTSMKYMQHDPAWSHDDRQIIFLSGSGGQSHDLWRLELQTGSLTQLTVGQLYNFEPNCSIYDEIAFSSNRNGNYDIWLTDFSGKNVTRLTDSLGIDSQPSWSPDGRQLVFVSNRDGKPALYIVNRDTGTTRRLTPNGLICRNPVWSR